MAHGLERLDELLRLPFRDREPVLDDVPRRRRAERRRQHPLDADAQVGQVGGHTIVEEFERAYVAGVLEREGGKLTAAAKHADMDPKNFHEKLTRYGLRRASASNGE